MADNAMHGVVRTATGNRAFELAARAGCSAPDWSASPAAVGFAAYHAYCFVLARFSLM